MKNLVQNLLLLLPKVDVIQGVKVGKGPLVAVVLVSGLDEGRRRDLVLEWVLSLPETTVLVLVVPESRRRAVLELLQGWAVEKTKRREIAKWMMGIQFEDPPLLCDSRLRPDSPAPKEEMWQMPAFKFIAFLLSHRPLGTHDSYFLEDDEDEAHPPRKVCQLDGGVQSIERGLEMSSADSPSLPSLKAVVCEKRINR